MSKKEYPQNDVMVYQILEEKAQQSRALIKEDRKHLWFISTPKSGTGWLNQIFMNIFSGKPDWRILKLANNPLSFEISVEILREYPDYNLFSPAHHAFCNAYTLDLIETFQIKPVVLTRDIHSILLSLSDSIDMYYERQKKFLEQFSPKTKDQTEWIMPPLEFWDGAGKEEKINCVIDLYAGTIIRQFTTWAHAKQNRKLDFPIISFDQMQTDPGKTIEGILKYAAMEGIQDEVNSSLVRAEKQGTHFNPDSNRSLARFSQEQLERINGYKLYYPKLDLSPIGLA